MLEISGSDILHLKAIITGIERYDADTEKTLGFSPNPMKDYTLMRFAQAESGEAIVAIHDMTGKKIAEKKEFLLPGDHTFRIEGINKGIFLVSVSSGKIFKSGKLISISSAGGAKKIAYESENVVTDTKKSADSKGVKNTIQMQYSTGDQLKVTGTSGMMATVGMMAPNSNGSYTFHFVSCKDGDNNYYPVVRIGPQLWMAENLKTTKYNDNTDITNATTNSAWLALTGGGHCGTIMTRQIRMGSGVFITGLQWLQVRPCPTGWRAPTIDEWQTLAANTGGRR